MNNKKFNNNSSLTETGSNDEEKEKAYKCSKCQKAYKSISGIAGHLKSIHNEDYNP